MSVLASNVVGSQLTRDAGGHRHTVRYLVTASNLKEAMDQTVPHGTESSLIPNIFALDFAVSHVEGQPRQFQVDVTYRVPEVGSVEDDPPPPTSTGGTVQLGSRVQPATFTKDRLGNQLVTSHLFTDTGHSGTTPTIQPAEVEGFVPTTVLTVTRTENASPQGNAKFYVGRVNNGPFFGESARKWLCTAIEGFSEDLGTTYQVTYEFEFQPATWDVTVAFIDEKTQRPIVPLTPGTELRTYQLYNLANFGALALE